MELKNNLTVAVKVSKTTVTDVGTIQPGETLTVEADANTVISIEPSA